jgi:hypothetical protein
METVFYILASGALAIHLVEKIAEIVIDFKELRRALRIKKTLKKVHIR